ncbi:uncharacterized protein LOC126821668 isoform X2 [Patella vulgata]|nr:uncharacterized protein LOC126821668 isoform X2 [Patella vulgata]
MNEREMIAKRSDENISRESQTERSKNNDGRHKERKLSMNYDKETQTDERKSCELRDRETQTIRRLVYSQRTQTDDENQTNDESGSKENKWGVWTYLFPPTGQTKKDEESQTEYLCHLDEIVRPCDIRWLQEEYLHAQGEIERLKVELLRSVNTSELSQQPAPPIIRKVGVEIYNPGQATDIVQLMEESLKRDLQSRLSAHNVKIEFNTTSGGGGKLSAPAIVLCPNFSRLGTDVNSAFSGLQDSGDGTVLLVVYYKEEHNLPKVKSEQILSQFNRLGAILDMGFTKDRGFYPTNINHQSFECLVHFVLKYVI